MAHSEPTLAEAGPSQPRAAVEIQALLSRETAKQKLQRIATAKRVPFNPLCEFTTVQACRDKRAVCHRTHFEPIMRSWTDPSLGYCSYLNLCYGDPLFRKNPSLGDQGGGPGARTGTKECRYQHFQVAPVPVPSASRRLNRPPRAPGLDPVVLSRLFDPASVSDDQARAAQMGQWVDCDLRSFDYSVLGQFQVIIADPPWDIHMTLPYGTMTDDEMRSLPLPSLQPDWGILCLWVTGRAMELGRELLDLWGYRRVDELVWVKVNQVQRLIRTGRTGHWLNHTCEHLLIALKMPDTHPRDSPIPYDTHPALRALRKGIDTDVVVAEVRETSRKPDEVYGVIERLAPHGRKLELFGRKHNVRPGWLTLGNQLGESKVVEKSLHERLTKRYPDQTFNLADLAQGE